MHFILILKHTSKRVSPHPDTAITSSYCSLTLSAHQTAALDTPAITSNTARPANDISKSDITMSKRGNLTGNKTTQQTNKHDINSTANEEIKLEETKNLLQK